MWNLAFWSFSNIEHLLHHPRPKHSCTPLDASKPHKHTHTPLLCSQKPPPVNLGQFRATTDTNWHPATPTDVPRHPKRLFEDVWPFRLTSNGICWCLLGSDGVWWCLLVCHVVCRCGDGVSGVCQRVSERCLWTCVRFWCIWCWCVFRPCMAKANALYWKSFERQNSTQLTLLKHQNTKTAQYKLPKNHWVIALFEIFGSSETNYL